MQDHPDTRLVIIDTFMRIRGPLPGKDKYAEEYQRLAQLQALAVRYRVAILLVHHLRKQGSDDWLEELSGSQAITGAADTLIGLFRERGQMDATLRTVSRDAPEADLALKFGGAFWELMGNADEYRMSVERSEILEALRQLGGEAKVKEIAELADKTPANTSKLLNKLAEAKAVKRVAYGTFAFLQPVEPVEVLKSEPEPQPLQLLQPTDSKELSEGEQ